jgi:hypothetical protein
LITIKKKHLRFLALFFSGIVLATFFLIACSEKPAETPTPTMTSEGLTTVNQSPRTCEVRAVWINPLAFGGYSCDDPAGKDCWPLARGEPEVIARINSFLDKLQSAHLNTLIVASPSIDGNCGWANIFAFEDFIELAKQRGFSMHLWVANKDRPDASCANAQADFSDPQEKYRQADWIVSLMKRYGKYFDGVHLDYIRYDDWRPIEGKKMGTVDPATGEEIGVTATVKQIHLALQENFPGKKLTAAVVPMDPARAGGLKVGNLIRWEEDVPAWFSEWFTANPGNWYEVANPLYLSVPRQMKYQQDSVTWLRESYVDGLMIMQYTIDDEEWSREVNFWKIFANYKQDSFSKVYMGLGWDKNYTQDPAHVVRKIENGRANGVSGFSIFQLSAWDSSLNNGNGDFVDDTPLIRDLTVDSEENNFNAPYKETIPSCLTVQ